MKTLKHKKRNNLTLNSKQLSIITILLSMSFAVFGIFVTKSLIEPIVSFFIMYAFLYFFIFTIPLKKSDEQQNKAIQEMLSKLYYDKYKQVTFSADDDKLMKQIIHNEGLKFTITPIYMNYASYSTTVTDIYGEIVFSSTVPLFILDDTFMLSYLLNNIHCIFYAKVINENSISIIAVDKHNKEVFNKVVNSIYFFHHFSII